MIKIGFSTRNNILSRTIRWITHSKVSHCWLLFHDSEFDCDMVMESTIEGFRLIPIELFKKKNVIVNISEPKYSLDAGLKQAGQWLGDSYDICGLIGAVIPMIGRWFKRKWHNPFNSKSQLFCSEVIVKIMQVSNYPGSQTYIAEDTSPEDLLEFFNSEK